MVDVRRLIDDVGEIDSQIASEKAGAAGVLITGSIGSVHISQTGGRSMGDALENRPQTSAWANGSFYLFALALVIAGIGYLAQGLPAYTLVIIIAAGVLLVPLAGALQLRNDEKLAERSFLELIKLVVSQLPLLRKFGGRGK
jgi:hypothetical protein